MFKTLSNHQLIIFQGVLFLVISVSLYYLFALNKNDNFNNRKLNKGLLSSNTQLIDYGEVSQVSTKAIEITNNEKNPAYIFHIYKSCGCTEVIFPKKVILPSETIKVDCTFDPEGKIGVNNGHFIVVYGFDPENPDDRHVLDISTLANVVSLEQ